MQVRFNPNITSVQRNTFNKKILNLNNKQAVTDLQAPKPNIAYPIGYVPIRKISFGSEKQLSELFPAKLVKALPEDTLKATAKYIPIETITARDKNGKLRLNALGKELVANLEGKLCKIGKFDRNKLDYYLLKGTDFDGTISMLVNKADDARPMPGTIESLLAISSLPNSKAGIITGRSIDNLLARIKGDNGDEKLIADIKKKLFISGLHGLQEFKDGKYSLNVTQEQQKKMDKLRNNIKESKKAGKFNENIEIEDKGCAFAFSYDPFKNDQDILKQALKIIKKSGITVVKPETRGNENILKLIAKTGVKTIDNNQINEKNKDSVFKLINGSGVLELVPLSSNKGILFEKVFDNYKKSISTELKENPEAKILLSYSGDDMTDFDAHRKIKEMKGKYGNKVESGSVYVINNRGNKLQPVVDEINDNITSVGISKYQEFLNGQKLVLDRLNLIPV